MRRKDGAAIMIGSALVVLAVFVVLPMMGIDIVNPILPVAVANVKINSNNLVVNCVAGETTTIVTFNKGTQLSLISPQSFEAPEIVPAKTSEEELQPLGIFYPPCVGGVGGGHFVLHFEVPSINYYRTSVMKRACCNPIYEDFAFNYQPGNIYNWNLVVYDGTGQQVYWTKSGQVEL